MNRPTSRLESSNFRTTKHSDMSSSIGKNNTRKFFNITNDKFNSLTENKTKEQLQQEAFVYLKQIKDTEEKLKVFNK